MTPRSLNTTELSTIERLIRKDTDVPIEDLKSHRVHGDFKHAFLNNTDFLVRYCNRDGGFTICILESQEDNRMWIGASRKSKNDKPNRIRGEMMAFMRAIRHSTVEV